MSILDRFNTELGKSFDDYVNTYLGPQGVAFTSPNKTAYDIAVNEAAAKVPSQALEGTFPGMTGQVLGTLSDFTMPALALGASPFYDMYQAGDRARAQYGIFNDSDPNVLGVTGDSEIPMGPSFPEYAKAVADENILSSALGRTAGAGQNLVNRFSRIKDGIVANIPESIFTSAYAPEISEKDRRSIDITDKVDDYYEKGEMMDNVVDAPKDGILQGLISKFGDSAILDYIKSGGMIGMAGRGITSLANMFGDSFKRSSFYNPKTASGNRLFAPGARAGNQTGLGFRRDAASISRMLNRLAAGKPIGHNRLADIMGKFGLSDVDTNAMSRSIAESAKTGYGGHGSSDAAAAAASTGGRDYSNSPGAMAGDMEYGEE